jgi:hypothetical protein
VRVLTPKNPAAPPGPNAAPFLLPCFLPGRLPGWRTPRRRVPRATPPSHSPCLARSSARPPQPPRAQPARGLFASPWRRTHVAACLGSQEQGAVRWGGEHGRGQEGGGAGREAHSGRGGRQAGSQGRSTAHRRSSRTGPGRGHLNSRAPRQEWAAKQEAEPAACRPNSF